MPAFATLKAGILGRRQIIDRLTFDTGWGLAVYCPGPALACLLLVSMQQVKLVTAMLIGMALFAGFEILGRARCGDQTA